MRLRVIHIVDARGVEHTFAILVAPDGVEFGRADDTVAVSKLFAHDYAEHAEDRPV